MSKVAEKTRVKVEIFGQEYTIIGDKPSQHIMQVAQEVDELMDKLRKSYPHLPLGKVAVLAALNLANDLASLREDYQWLVQIIEEEKKNHSPA